MPYEARLPADVKLPPGYSIKTDDPRFAALRSLAERERLSQAAFSELLGIEARRVIAEHERARAAQPPAAPAPAKPAVPEGWSKMTTRKQLAYALANGPTRSPQS
jgi:hypothetical protein